MAVEEIKIIKRGGLRIYIYPAVGDAQREAGVFYSRFECGPFYRWSFGEESLRWRSERVRPSALSVKAFCVASWISLPPALQARLDEHYSE